MSEKTTPSKKSTTPWRQGTSYKAGKYFQFDSRQILVMTAWPDPRAWRRTKTIDWKQVRKQADERLDVLATLIQAYEAKHYAIAPPDPIEAIKFRMEQGGLSIKDLEPLIGKSNRVYEVLGRTRPLTLPMIRRLHKGLGIPAEVLIAQTAYRQARLALPS